jgi:hypothetical protein
MGFFGDEAGAKMAEMFPSNYGADPDGQASAALFVLSAEPRRAAGAICALRRWT